MPAISTPFGPLVEPGWPSTLPEGANVGAKFMAGAALGAQINARQRQLENQLAQYSLKAQQNEYDRQHDRDMYNLAVEKMGMQNAFTEQRLALSAEDNKMQAQRNEDLYRLGLRSREDAEAKTQLAITKYNDVLEGRGEFVNTLATLSSEGLYPGMKGYDTEFNKLMGPVSQKVPTQLLNAWQKGVYNNHNYSASKEIQDYVRQNELFRKKVADTVWGSLDTDLNPILHPEMLPKEADKTEGGWFGTGYGATKRTPTGRVLVTNASGTIKDRPVFLKDLEGLKTEYDELMKRYRNLPTQVNKPEIGVWAKGQSTNLTPIPIPKDKSLLEINRPYTSPKGIVRWTGDDFTEW